VDDLPRKANLERVGEDREDEAVEPCRKSGVPGRPAPVADLAEALGEDAVCEGEGAGDWTL